MKILSIQKKSSKIVKKLPDLKQGPIFEELFDTFDVDLCNVISNNGII